MMTEDGDERTIKSLDVCDQLVKACESLGWKTPSKIQVEAIPHALEGRDVIVLAQTGSCKTGAFALPIIQALLEKPQPFFACILSLTRELAIQISPQFEALGSSIGVKSSVVGTPGRLLDHLSNTKGFSLRMLKYLVLDEADRLLNMEFETAIDDILKDIPRECRTYLFSATMTKKDYIHRVGRTARAGRSGLAISLVNQYEVEWYIQIEQLIGKKLLEFPAEEAEVLLFLERVSDAKRISQMKIKESAGNKRGRKVGDDEELDAKRYAVNTKSGKTSKKGRS